MIYFQVKTTITLFKKTYKRLRNGMRAGSFHIKTITVRLTHLSRPDRPESVGTLLIKKQKHPGIGTQILS